MNRIALVCLILLSLPILLFVYQPGWSFGGYAHFIDILGKTLSPLILFSALWYTVRGEWNH